MFSHFWTFWNTAEFQNFGTKDLNWFEVFSSHWIHSSSIRDLPKPWIELNVDIIFDIEKNPLRKNVIAISQNEQIANKSLSKAKKSQWNLKCIMIHRLTIENQINNSNWHQIHSLCRQFFFPLQLCDMSFHDTIKYRWKCSHKYHLVNISTEKSNGFT